MYGIEQDGDIWVKNPEIMKKYFITIHIKHIYKVARYKNRYCMKTFC